MIAFLKKPLAWAIGAIILLCLILWLTNAFGGRARIMARLGANQADAALESGQDAVSTVGGVAERQSEADKITQENRDAIQAAPGANAPVDPALRDVGLASLCRRKSYSQHPECLQYAPAR